MRKKRFLAVGVLATFITLFSTEVFAFLPEIVEENTTP